MLPQGWTSGRLCTEPSTFLSTPAGPQQNRTTIVCKFVKVNYAGPKGRTNGRLGTEPPIGPPYLRTRRLTTSRHSRAPRFVLATLPDDENKRVRTSAHENDVKAEILKEKKAAQKALRKDIEVRVEGMIETLKEKMTEADAEKKEIEEQRADWREKITEAEAASTRMAKECEADQKRIESLLRERDILNKNVVKADERTKQQIELVRNKETEVAQLRKDITKWKAEAQEFRKKIFQMEKQREKVAVDLSVANSKYYAGLEELKARDERLGEIHKQIGDVNTKLANQKNLYDAVVADRNVYSKNLIESNEEIATMDVQFKVMYNDIGQVKDEIREKDHTLVREKFVMLRSCHCSHRRSNLKLLRILALLNGTTY